MAQMDMAGNGGIHAVAITDSFERLSRRVARSWALAGVALFVGLSATVGFPHGPDLQDWERQGQLATLVVLTIASAIAWRWEGLGGSILILGSVSLGVFAALQHQPLVAFLPAAVFLVPGIGFLVAWRRTRTYAAIVTLVTALVMVLVTGAMAAQAMYNRGFGPAHPQSGLPPLPTSPVLWHWSGGVTDIEAVVVAAIDTENEPQLTVIAPDGTAKNCPGNRDNEVWRFVATDLDPNTRYRYWFEVDGAPVKERTGELHTFTTEPTSFTVAAGSCARLGSNGRVYETIRNADPDLFVVPGDFFYGDFIESRRQLVAAYEETLTRPAQAALFAEVPVAYVWDDHDYGGNDSDSTSPMRSSAIDVYGSFVPHYTLASTESINQAFSIGRVRFIMLDTRSQRDPNETADAPDKTMLGAAQLQWLETELLAARDRYPLTVLVTSVPWIAAPEPGADHWGGFAQERAHIADFIAANDITGILLLAGDAHMVAIDDGTNTDFSAVGDVTLPLLHAAALDRPGSVKGGPYSEGTYPGGGQFGLIAVTDTGGDLIEVKISGHDWEGTTLVEYSFQVPASEVTS